MITYHLNEKITSEAFIDILQRSGLSERRPVDKLEIIDKMIKNANFLVSARNKFGELVGIARCITDYAYCCYLSCLAVDKDYQSQGIGKALIKEILSAIGEESSLLLLSAPGTESYYLKTGFEVASNAYLIRRRESHKAALEFFSGEYDD